MPLFQYEALDATGKPKKGAIEAPSSEEAIQRIKLEGYFPTTVREQKVKRSAKSPAAQDEGKRKSLLSLGGGGKKKKKGSALVLGGVSKKQLTLFTRQMSVLQDAGLPLLRSIQILESQLKPCKLKFVLQQIAEDIEGGTTLSEAMAKHPKVFNSLYTKMVAAGEVGGVLDVILQRLAEFMEKAQRLKSKVVGAMIYPAAVITVALLILTAIMYFIIPKFQEIFTDMGIKLPGITLGLINFSSWVAGTASPDQLAPGAIYILFAPVVVVIVYKLLRKTPFGRAALDFVTLRVPVIGPLIRKTVIARFTRTLGTLITAGVPILEAVTITKNTCGNWVFERALGKVHDSIREGETIAEPLRQAKVCDAIVVNMIDVGEETGDIDTMLMKIADNYDEEVDIAIGGLIKLIEPMLVVVLGGIVGTIVVAMFMPMVEMINSLQKQN